MAGRTWKGEVFSLLYKDTDLHRQTASEFICVKFDECTYLKRVKLSQFQFKICNTSSEAGSIHIKAKSGASVSDGDLLST